MKKKDISVVQIITKLELGGAQKVCLSIMDGLKNHDIPTFLISGQEGSLVSKVNPLDHVYLLPHFKREISIPSFFLEIKNFFHIIKHIKSLKKLHKNLIVHTHSTKAGIIGRWAAWAAGIEKRIHTIHGFAFHNHQNWLTWLTIYLLELFTSLITTHFICVSSEDVKIGLQLFPRFSKKHSIIRAAVDWEKFYIPAYKTIVTPHTKNSFIFGTIACFKKQKNLIDLLQAFNCVHQKNPLTKLEIIGDGILRPQLESWIRDHNLQNAVTLHGWQEQVQEYMLTWHAFVLSSLWEGLPCAIIEARLLKLPIIAYNTGGIHDVITHQKNGFLVEQKNWKSLATYMNTIATNNHIYQRLCLYQDDLEDFKTSRMIEQHIQLYQDI
jgi:glycosyltransferase involved in cell wall biosynthesis